MITTGLQKKTNEELINIILRKDDVEKYLRQEIKQLNADNERLRQELASKDWDDSIIFRPKHCQQTIIYFAK